MKGGNEYCSERLLLRRWRLSDATALYNLAKDAEVGPRAGWAPHTSCEKSAEIIRTLFDNDSTWAILFKSSEELVGAIGYGPSCDCHLPALDGELAVGYWIGREYWNRGLCTEALRAMLKYVEEHTDIKSLISGHYVDNPASGRVMEKCGFVPTGEYCTDLTLYGDSSRKIRVLRWRRLL